MSISVKNSNGDWVQCAGQGRAEYGASTVRTGTVTFTALADSWNVVEITFDTPMPDDDYLVIFEATNVAYVHVQQVMSKTINGFNAIVWNRDELTSSRPGYIKYTAFKLYTDTEYNQVLNSMIRVKQVRIQGTDFDIATTTYGGWYAAKISGFYAKCGLNESENTIINVAADNNAGAEEIPLIVRDSSSSNFNPYHTVGISSPQESVISSTSYVEFKVFYINTVLGNGV